MQLVIMTCLRIVFQVCLCSCYPLGTRMQRVKEHTALRAQDLGLRERRPRGALSEPSSPSSTSPRVPAERLLSSQISVHLQGVVHSRVSLALMPLIL